MTLLVIPAGENTSLVETKENYQSVSYQVITVGFQRKRMLLELFERKTFWVDSDQSQASYNVVGGARSAISLHLWLEMLQVNHIFLLKGRINTRD